MTTTLVLDEDVQIPMSLRNLADFREWALSDDFPERGRFDYIAGRVEVDFSLRDIFCHGAVMAELVRVLGNHVKDHDMGQIFMSRCRVSSPKADLSVQPDVFYFSYETIESGRARLVPHASGMPGRCVEIEGAMDLIVEIVDDASETKDKHRLPPAYFQAGVRELWLVDARGDELQFQIHHRGETEFRPARSDEEGFQFSQVFKRRYKLERDCKTPGHWQYDLQVTKWPGEST